MGLFDHPERFPAAQIDFDGPSKAKMTLLGPVAKRACRTARNQTIASVKRALFSTIRKRGNAKYGVDKLAPRSAFTVQLHGGSAKDVFGRFTDKRYLVSYKRGESQIIGWVDNIHVLMSMLQSADRFKLSAASRHNMHAGLARRGLRGAEVPREYSRPARDVIEPFGAGVAPFVPQWFDGSFAKAWKKGMAR